MEGGGMCRIRLGAILGAKGSSAGAVENGMARVLKVALACRRTVRAHALAARQPLPPAGLLSQPVRAGARLRQRTAARPLWHNAQVAGKAAAVGADRRQVL